MSIIQSYHACTGELSPLREAYKKHGKINSMNKNRSKTGSQEQCRDENFVKREWITQLRCKTLVQGENNSISKYQLSILNYIFPCN